jgi:hypothetical protein
LPAQTNILARSPSLSRVRSFRSASLRCSSLRTALLGTYALDSFGSLRFLPPLRLASKASKPTADTYTLLGEFLLSLGISSLNNFYLLDKIRGVLDFQGLGGFFCVILDTPCVIFDTIYTLDKTQKGSYNYTKPKKRRLGHEEEVIRPNGH